MPLLKPPALMCAGRGPSGFADGGQHALQLTPARGSLALAFPLGCAAPNTQGHSGRFGTTLWSEVGSNTTNKEHRDANRKRTRQTA